MRRRLSYWASQGCIYYAAGVEEEGLQKAVGRLGTGYPAVSDRDKELVITIAEQGEVIMNHIMRNCQVQNMVSSLTNLINACQRWVAQPEQGPDDDVQVYNKTTCFEFHQLFVATLLAYGRVLDALYTAQKERRMPDAITNARHVWHCSTILWRLAYSDLLPYHLGILNKKGWLRVPVYDEDNVEIFRRFTGFEHPQYKVTRRQAMDPDRVGDVDREQDDPDAQEYSSRMELIADPAQVYLRLVHILADHWEALSIIADHAVTTNAPTRIIFLAAKFPSRDPRVCKVKNWELMVKEVIRGHTPSLSISIEDVLQHLRTEIADPKYQGLPTFAHFKSQIPRWQGNLHCEGILASLLDADVDDARFGPCAKLLKVIYFSSVITMLVSSYEHRDQIIGLFPYQDYAAQLVPCTSPLSEGSLIIWLFAVITARFSRWN